MLTDVQDFMFNEKHPHLARTNSYRDRISLIRLTEHSYRDNISLIRLTEHSYRDSIHCSDANRLPSLAFPQCTTLGGVRQINAEL